METIDTLLMAKLELIDIYCDKTNGYIEFDREGITIHPLGGEPWTAKNDKELIKNIALNIRCWLGIEEV